MELKFTNSKTGRKEKFCPLQPQRITVYACGPTVYDPPHIGNIRSAVVYDLLYRLLLAAYPERDVIYLRNITDVDDKIIDKAITTQRPIAAITAEMTAAYHHDTAYVGCLPPTHEPRATEHIGEMISMIEKLLDRGHAYIAAGHVLFDVASYRDYGELSGREQGGEAVSHGARVEVAAYKGNPADFVLWKPAGERDSFCAFPSPWGMGRPGWHIECSAMIHKHFGHSFDIHGGGNDLIFPHHENEIAQSRCCYDGEFARYWLHNGFVVVDGRKMSKSLGNCYKIADVAADGVSGMQLRYFYLMKHYRKPLDYTRETLANAQKSLQRLYRGLKAAYVIMPSLVVESGQRSGGVGAPAEASIDSVNMVLAAVSDDLNTPLALSHLAAMAERLIGAPGEGIEDDVERLACGFIGGLKLLGFDPELLAAEFEEASATAAVEVPKAVQELAAARWLAKQDRDWGRADVLRQEIAALGYEVRDRSGGYDVFKTGATPPSG